MTTAVDSPLTSYPVRLTIDRAEKQSRLTNFPLGIGFLIRSLILIPHYVVLYFFQLAAYLVYFIATIVILFSGRYPEGLFNFFVGYTRWTTNVYAYIFSLVDGYPPFSMDQQPGYPVVLEVDYEGAKSRLLNFPVLGLFIKFVLTIPHLIILFFLMMVAFLVVFIAQFAILFTGSFPSGMHGFVTGTVRWYTRVQAYTYGLTDRYPPFSMD